MGPVTRTGVLFMQSQWFFGADSQVHATIMRHLPRDRFVVHCAVPAPDGELKTPSFLAVEQIPDVHLRPTRFGPSLDSSHDCAELLLDATRSGIPAAASLLGLVRHVRRNNIKIIHCTEKPRDAVYGSYVAALSGARCVIHVHVKAEPWIRKMVRRAMHRSAALIGVSEFVAQSIRELGLRRALVCSQCRTAWNWTTGRSTQRKGSASDPNSTFAPISPSSSAPLASFDTKVNTSCWQLFPRSGAAFQM